MVRRLLSSRTAAPAALVVVLVLSVAARSALLGQPCQSPCTSGSQHTLIFDEAYYVNAARVIAGIRPAPGAHYADAPLGTDPNAEHPQLAKLIMAGAIELFGDGPFAWRIGSLIFGTVAILGMYFLVRWAGGGPWTGVTAATLMAADNLLLVHGRIGTLDIYTVAMMVWAVALYLRGWPLRAGLALGLAAAFKLVGPYAAFALVLLELARWATRLRLGAAAPAAWRVVPVLRRLLLCLACGALAFLVALTIMDQIATPYADATGQLITSPLPFAHVLHMIVYAEQQISPNGPQGIASYPWAWLVDLKPIVYLQINPSLPAQGLYGIHPVCRFLGMISPPIMLLELPALALGLWRLARPPRQAGVPGGAELVVAGGAGGPAGTVASSGAAPAEGVARGGPGKTGGPAGAAASLPRGPEARALAAHELQMALLGPAWFLGTWVPFALLSAIDQRTSYLYYMVIVMPGIYVADAWLVSQLWRLRRRWVRVLLGLWALAVLVAVVVMYPFDPLFI